MESSTSICLCLQFCWCWTAAVFPGQPAKNERLFNDSAGEQIQQSRPDVLLDNLSHKTSQTLLVEMDHGKDHHHHAATQHGKKGHDDSKHQAEENQAPRAGFQLGQVNKNDYFKHILFSVQIFC